MTQEGYLLRAWLDFSIQPRTRPALKLALRLLRRHPWLAQQLRQETNVRFRLLLAGDAVLGFWLGL